MKTIRIWLREDGDAPSVLQLGTLPKPEAPGRVFDVTGTEERPIKNRAQAVACVLDALRVEPVKRKDRSGWTRWDQAQDCVVEVIRG